RAAVGDHQHAPDLLAMGADPAAVMAPFVVRWPLLGVDNHQDVANQLIGHGLSAHGTCRFGPPAFSTIHGLSRPTNRAPLRTPPGGRGRARVPPRDLDTQTG